MSYYVNFSRKLKIKVKNPSKTGDRSKTYKNCVIADFSLSDLIISQTVLSFENNDNVNKRVIIINRLIEKVPVLSCAFNLIICTKFSTSIIKKIFWLFVWFFFFFLLLYAAQTYVQTNTKPSKPL